MCRGNKPKTKRKKKNMKNTELKFRVKNNFGEWVVEGTDNNGQWISVDPGATYIDQSEAEEAAEAWAKNRDGEFIGMME